MSTNIIYDIDAIKYLAQSKGSFFFSPSAMRFFKSRVSNRVYQGVGGIFFITSEKNDDNPRYYTIRKFDPDTGRIDTQGDFYKLSKKRAHRLAYLYSIGES